jgi:hypothetical protein
LDFYADTGYEFGSSLQDLAAVAGSVGLAAAPGSTGLVDVADAAVQAEVVAHRQLATKAAIAWGSKLRF